MSATRTSLAARARVVALATVLAVTSFAVTAAPGSPPADDDGLAGVFDGLTALLAPRKVLAAFCASNPSFTGRLTASTSSTTAVSRITDPDLYAYISNVDAAWSCTAFLRYSGIAWNTTATAGRFDWGNLINSTSVACNWVVGTTDYAKANGTTDCADTDAEYAMEVTLTAQRVYQADVAHNGVGDLSFVHADCGTYYANSGTPGKVVRGTESAPQSFATTNVGNRPGANCDPLTLDSFGTSQVITYDATAPTVAITAPAAGTATVTDPSVTVTFNVADKPTGAGGNAGIASWSLGRQIAPQSGTACAATWTADAGAGALVTGTAGGTGLTSGQVLPSGSCYRWTLTATDQNGNTATPVTSGVVRRDASTLLGTPGHARLESFDLGAGDSLAVNVATGNVLVTHPVVSLPIRGSSVSIGLAYNSGDPANIGMGQGWRLNIDRRLESPAWGSDIVFTGADGARHRFTWVPGTSSYAHPATLYATLAQNGSGYRLAYRDNGYDLFASTGLLAEERDRHGNGVTFDRSVANQVSVVDAAGGRSIVLAYPSGRPTTITDWAVVSNGIVQASGTGNRVSTLLYDAGGTLTGWADPLNTTGSCPTGGSHLTCLTYANGLLTGVTKTQTPETLTSGVLGMGTPRAVTTSIAYRGGDVASVTDAEGAQTAFTRPAQGQTLVERPGTPASQTRYGLVTPADSLARVASVWRKLGAAWIEQRTTYAPAFATEPASVIENHVNGIVGDGSAPTVEDRRTAYTYGAGTRGPNLLSIEEPLAGMLVRRTDLTYNENQDVTGRTVSEAGDAVKRTTTRYCYHPTTCNLGDADAKLWRVIENYVDGVAGNGAVGVEDITTTYGYDIHGQRTRETRASDAVATGWTYDTQGNVTAEIRNYVSGTVTDPGDDITPNTTTNARTDLTTAFGYDTAGNQVSVADPRRAIDAVKQLTLAADDYISRTVFDPLNQPVTTRLPSTPTRIVAACSPSPACREATTTYDERGLVRESRDVAGKVTATTYDAAGRALVTYQDDDGTGGTAARITGKAGYDAAGRMLWSEDAVQANDPAGGTDPGRTEYVYGELGRTTSTIEAAGSTLPVVAATTTTLYDALDRRTAETVGIESPDAPTTRWTYDIGGRVLDQNDAFTCSTSSYDYRDLVLGVTEGRTGGTTCTGTGTRTLVHAYDALGRLTSRTVAGGATLEATVYDAAGRALATTATEGTTERVTETTWNALDEPVTEYGYTKTGGVTGGETWARANRDPAGNETDRCTWAAQPSEWCKRADQTFANPQPTTRSTSGYDAANRRISLYTPGVGATTYDPAANYQVSGVHVPTAAGVEHQTRYGYDTRDRLDTITVILCSASEQPCSSGNKLSERVVDDYGYDDNDNRTQVAENSGSGVVTRTYGYDGRNQLITDSSTATTCGGQSFTYDAAGNRTCAGGRTFTYLDSRGQLESCSGTACAPVFDADGRLARITTATGTWSYLYDGDGRMTSACRSTSCAGSGFARLDSVYDGEGHRVRLVETPASGTATITDFTYAGDAVVREVATTGTTLVTRTFTVDEAGAILKLAIATTPVAGADDGTYLVVWNGHGDAVELAKIDPSTGLLTSANRFTYSTWGTPTLATVNGYGDLGFRYRYVGRFDVQWDSTAAVPAELLYMHARHYHPEFGRFLQPDPSALEANLYAYAGNSPVTMVDPSGHFAFIPILMIVAKAAIALAPGFIAAALRLAPVLQRQASQTAPMVQRLFSWVSGGARNPVLTATKFRENLSRFTGIRPGPLAQAHHNFPQLFWPRWRAMGIQWNDPKFMSWWPSGPAFGWNHQVNAKLYNDLWKLFLDTNPSKGEVIRFGRALARAFGLYTYF